MSTASDSTQPLRDFPAGSTWLRRLALVYYLPAAALGFVIFGVGGLLLTIFSALVYFILPRRRRAILGRWIIHTLFAIFVGYLRLTRLIRFDYTALDALRETGALIIAPNHPSLLDAVFIISRLPRVACVMKAAILDNPVLGGGARLAGYIRNDSPGTLVHHALEQLAAGHQLLLFPEGTRTVNPPLNELKGGFAMIATRAGVPVQTIRLETSSAFLGKNWSWTQVPHFPLQYRARLGERLAPEAGESSRDFMERVRISMLREQPGIGNSSS